MQFPTFAVPCALPASANPVIARQGHLRALPPRGARCRLSAVRKIGAAAPPAEAQPEATVIARAQVVAKKAATRFTNVVSDVAASVSSAQAHLARGAAQHAHILLPAALAFLAAAGAALLRAVWRKVARDRDIAAAAAANAADLSRQRRRVVDALSGSSATRSAFEAAAAEEAELQEVGAASAEQRTDPSLLQAFQAFMQQSGALSVSIQATLLLVYVVSLARLWPAFSPDVLLGFTLASDTSNIFPRSAGKGPAVRDSYRASLAAAQGCTIQAGASGGSIKGCTSAEAGAVCRASHGCRYASAAGCSYRACWFCGGSACLCSQRGSATTHTAHVIGNGYASRAFIRRSCSCGRHCQQRRRRAGGFQHRWQR